MDSDLIPCNVKIITCDESNECVDSDSLSVSAIEEPDWTSIPLAMESAISIDAEDDKIEEETLILHDDESALVNEYATQFILIDNTEDVDVVEKIDQQQTPYFLLESGIVDQVVLLQQDDECIETISQIQRKKPKNHICQVPGCDRAYSSPHHLKVHERIHTGDRPYKCSFEGCSKEFNTEYGRKAHIRTHTGEKPYICTYDGCSKGFKTSGDLHKHNRTHTGERPFLCPMLGCDKSFTTSNICRIHIRSHTGERPYVCQEEGCDKIFASSTNFKNHMRIHTGEKPYSCQVAGCGRRFTEYSSLYKHRLVHSQAKRYQCSFCDKSYRQMSSLTTHKRIEHSVILHSNGRELLLEHTIENELDND